MNNDEYSLINNLYNQINISLSDKSNVNKLMNAIRKYADSHSSLLLSTDLSNRLIFSESDKKILYDVTGLTAKDVTSAIKKSPVIKPTWKVANNPFYILSILVMIYFARNNKNKELDAITVYMSYVLYTTSHKASFKYLPNKQIMDYTINNLSNRYILKQVGSIQGVIEHTVLNAIHGRFESELKDGSDDNIRNILSALETRISSVLKYIATEFYKNYEDKNFLFHEEEDTSEENYHLSDNNSFKINKITTLVTTSIVSEGFDQQTIIKRSINLNAGASAKKLEPMLRTIIEQDMQSIPELISNIITLFIYKGNSINDIRTMKFVSESLQIYKSNSQDDITFKIKEKLLHWINITAEKYGRNFISRGKTSLDTYRRAIYTCFIFKILECSKS